MAIKYNKKKSKILKLKNKKKTSWILFKIKSINLNMNCDYKLYSMDNCFYVFQRQVMEFFF